MESNTVLVSPLNEAKRFIEDCFEAVDTCKKHAEVASETLIEADYRGHFSHGMNRLNAYIGDILENKVNPNALPQIEKETAATALINGNNGLGAVIGRFCMELAIKKAKEVGIGMVTAYQSNHYGIAGIYSLQAMKEGCIGISVTNTSPVMVPTRAKAAALGANPISFGIPGKNNDNLVLDMATTTVAVGKIEVHRRQGKYLPEGWVVNENGHTETDPERALKAKRLLPLGGAELTAGYKGYGLSLIIEVLSGILSGSNYGPHVPLWRTGDPRAANLGQAFIAIDPSVFAPGYQDRLEDLMNHIRHMEPKNPDQPVLIPGDPERIHMEKVDVQGGLCYVEDQHNSNKLLAEKLKVKPMNSIKK